MRFAHRCRNLRKSCGSSGAAGAGRGALGAGTGWACGDVSISMDVLTFRDMSADEYRELYDVETDVSIEADVVDQLIAGGQGAVERNAAARAFSAGPSAQ